VVAGERVLLGLCVVQSPVHATNVAVDGGAALALNGSSHVQGFHQGAGAYSGTNSLHGFMVKPRNPHFHERRFFARTGVQFVFLITLSNCESSQGDTIG